MGRNGAGQEGTRRDSDSHVTTDQKGDHFHRNHRGPGDHRVWPETGRVITLR